MWWTVSQGHDSIGDVLPPVLVAGILDAYDLGDGTMSDAPVAYGRMGEIWRLDAASGPWAVKTGRHAVSEEDLADSVRFHEAAGAAGLPVPSVRRTRDGCVTSDIAGRQVRVLEWVDMGATDPDLDPVAVGSLLAALHRLPDARALVAERTAEDIDPWFRAAVGGAAWDDLVADLDANGAPFAAALAGHRDELVELEGLLAEPQGLLWCHNDLFSDNVRSTPDGGLVVFDFDSSGPGDPGWELAHALVEYATTPRATHAGVDIQRARALHDAYVDTGGPGRLHDRADFTMVIAVLGHIAEIASCRWLAASDPAERGDLAAWVAELTDRPLTRLVIDELLEACR